MDKRCKIGLWCVHKVKDEHRRVDVSMGSSTTFEFDHVALSQFQKMSVQLGGHAIETEVQRWQLERVCIKEVILLY